MNTEALQSSYDRHPKPAGEKYAYGTAGFRMNHSKLESVVFRVGILAALRSKCLNGQTIGVMITASHNPPEDNGVKLVDPFGDMLVESWEAHATELANAESFAELSDQIRQIVAQHSIDLSTSATVVYGRDSRASSEFLAGCLWDGIQACGAAAEDFGLLTTPQLHYITRCRNDPEYGKPSELGYYEKLSSAFNKLAARKSESPRGIPNITVDCANGVGGPKLAELSHYLAHSFHLTPVNTSYTETHKLNESCGADFVKTNQKAPLGVSVDQNLYASFDGDADRVVFYYATPAGEFHLLDGDKISGLLAAFLQQLISSARDLAGKLRVGVVQTAYANGASTAYLTDTLGLPVECTATGVKHLHHAAQKFDVGVYFEANGHGTVLFGPKVYEVLKETSSEEAQILKGFTELINQAVGDAISDLLAVISVLGLSGIGPADWDARYTDLPNKLAKVIVPDRSVFKTTDAERKLVEPAGLQEKIDAEVAKVSRGRSFVRASGTEDAVRVYAEAATREEVEALSAAVVRLVESL